MAQLVDDNDPTRPVKSSIEGLPSELLQQIFWFVPTPSLLLSRLVSRRFATTIEHLNWRLLCENRFKYWKKRPATSLESRHETATLDWKSAFFQRYRSSCETSSLLNSILSTQVGRIEKFQRVAEIGYSAKDALLQHMAADEDLEDGLARRFYSDAALGCVHRAMAIRNWVELESRAAISLEAALTSFNMFVLHDGQGDFDETNARLDSIVEAILADYPDFREKTTRQQATDLAAYLLKKDLVGISGDHTHNYHNLENNFIGFALHHEDHESLPLISSAIYCSIARRLGVDASPCALPFHVVARVMAPQGVDADGRILRQGQNAEPLFLDPFESDRELTTEWLVSRLRQTSVFPSQYEPFLEATSISDLVHRTGQNILVSVQQASRLAVAHQGSLSQIRSVSRVQDIDGAFYGALWACLLQSIPANGDGPIVATIRRRNLLPPFIEYFEAHFPSDVGLVEDHIIPIFQDSPESAQLRESVRVMRSVDSLPKQIKRRTNQISEHVLYRVGQVFRHRRYGYLAVITGWDTECGASQQWMNQMHVHELSRGASQSFYHVLVEDTSVRYVAEENIEIVRLEKPPSLMRLAGKHFKRWDAASKAFISNIKDEYPDD